MVNLSEKSKLLRPTAIGDLVDTASPAFLKNLREIVQPPGKRGSWLRHLSDKRLLEIYYRLKRGQSANSIAKMAQVEWGMLQSSFTKSLARSVSIFSQKAVGSIDRVDGPDAAKNKEDKEDAKKKKKAINTKFDALNDLCWLIGVQKQRVELLFEKEKTSVPFKFTDKSIKELRELLSLAIDTGIKLGTLDVKPSELNVNIKTKFDGILEHAIVDVDNMTDFATAFIEESTKKLSKTLVRTEDGRLLLQDKNATPGSVVIDVTPLPKEDEEDGGDNS
jgi:hypothetical protein